MPPSVLPVIVKGVLPTSNGCAVFLGNDDKTFVIYVDHFVGNVIRMSIDGVKKERPLTHDLIAHILTGLGARVEHVVINDVKESTFFARVLLVMENELGRKIVELDARPSDSIVLAIQHQRPLLVARSVFDSVEDMTDVLERVRQQTPDPDSQEDQDDDEDDDDDTGDFDFGLDDDEKK